MDKSKLITVVVVAVAVALGAWLVFNYQSKIPTAINSPKPTVKSSPQASPTSVSSQQRKIVTNPPKQGASNEEVGLFNDTVRQLAIDSGRLDVTGCNPVPFVIRVKKGQTLTVSNSDKKEHVLEVEEGIKIPNGETQVKAEFKHGAGIYVYGCDGSSAVGAILVVE